MPGRAAETMPLDEPGVAERNAAGLMRLTSGWRLPELPLPARWAPAPLSDSVTQTLEFSWAGEVARHVGSVVHRWMQRMAEDCLQGWNADRIERLRIAFGNQLAARGVGEAQCEAAIGRVVAALKQTLEDERGRWLLGDQIEARNEYRLGTWGEDGRREWVIDRTFVDQQGRRWIVDYKTSSHEGSDIDTFLDREKSRYAPQLERYARLLSHSSMSHHGPIHLGLYFPLLSAWREWLAGEVPQQAASVPML